MGTTDNFVGEIAGVTMYPKTLSASEIIAIRDDCEGVGVDTIGILTAVNFTSLLVLNMLLVAYIYTMSYFAWRVCPKIYFSQICIVKTLK